MRKLIKIQGTGDFSGGNGRTESVVRSKGIVAKQTAGTTLDVIEEFKGGRSIKIELTWNRAV